MTAQKDCGSTLHVKIGIEFVELTRTRTCFHV